MQVGKQNIVEKMSAFLKRLFIWSTHLERKRRKQENQHVAEEGQGNVCGCVPMV